MLWNLVDLDLSNGVERTEGVEITPFIIIDGEP